MIRTSFNTAGFVARDNKVSLSVALKRLFYFYIFNTDISQKSTERWQRYIYIYEYVSYIYACVYVCIYR